MFEDRIVLSIAETAKATGYSKEAIRKAIRLGKLAANRPGGDGDYRIQLEHVYAWLNGSDRPVKRRPVPGYRSTAA